MYSCQSSRHCSVRKQEPPVKLVNFEQCVQSGLLKEAIHCYSETGQHLIQSYLFHTVISSWLSDRSCCSGLKFRELAARMQPVQAVITGYQTEVKGSGHCHSKKLFFSTRGVLSKKKAGSVDKQHGCVACPLSG